MIKKIELLEGEQLDRIMKLWLETNIQAHDFIDRNYWQSNYEAVKEMMPQATIYAYQEEDTIQAFVGLMDNYIAGIFVSNKMQSKGIGKKLLAHCKNNLDELTLDVYQKNERAVQFYLREGFVITEEKIDENTKEIEYEMKWKKEL
ncbi:N-acetyltransferase [Candidatus Galacturonibacter soehngenii]|uniref:N-acetyltransferase n=1 Tax=Candidatus Galacturonatibacter soehngenii TaxID=2307010 RepID=A0A7V7QJU8_9FIRM|nr:N-acetyltransferase [Candidatus Galacturonibacter soehngenii]KAB1437964.1 N-acetyltransferase [Candidatus Galacturonibacter soehngenii]MBA4688976.1 N-acetyltransferase [Candidatus Galacturonibacter soehngenii]